MIQEMHKNSKKSAACMLAAPKDFIVQLSCDINKLLLFLNSWFMAHKVQSLSATVNLVVWEKVYCYIKVWRTADFLASNSPAVFSVWHLRSRTLTVYRYTINHLPWSLCWRQWAAIGRKGRPSSQTQPPGRWAAILPLAAGHSVWGCRRTHTAPHRILPKEGESQREP